MKTIKLLNEGVPLEAKLSMDHGCYWNDSNEVKRNRQLYKRINGKTDSTKYIHRMNAHQNRDTWFARSTY